MARTVSALNFTNTTISSNTATVSSYNKEADMIEVHSVEVKVVFVFVACVSTISTLSAITFLHRAKKVPYAAKFLSIGLLTFDVLFIVTSTIRKFVLHPYINLNIQTLVTMWLQLVVVTVVLMAIERYILISKPLWYLIHVTVRKVRTIVVSAWIIECFVWLFVRYGICYIKFQSVWVVTKPGFCNNIMSMSYAILLVTGFVISCTCYWKIFRIIQSTVTSGHIMSISDTVKVIRTYRSTSIVFVFILVITCTTLAYVAIIIFIQLGLLNQTGRRISIEIVSLFNCILDPFLYAIWFKECRLEMLKCIAFVFRWPRERVDKMQIEVYNIVTTEFKAKTITETIQ